MHEVQCRLCKERFDTETEEAVLIGKKSYYHKKCYDIWISQKGNARAELDENFWKEAMIDFLYRDVGMSGMNFMKINNQWNRFVAKKENMTPKGIYFAVRYFYEVKKGNVEKALGGIGIVPSIYKESAQYWTDLERRKTGTLDAIISQITKRDNREVKIITRKEQTKKDKAKWSLDSI